LVKSLGRSSVEEKHIVWCWWFEPTLGCKDMVSGKYETETNMQIRDVVNEAVKKGLDSKKLMKEIYASMRHGVATSVLTKILRDYAKKVGGTFSKVDKRLSPGEQWMQTLGTDTVEYRIDMPDYTGVSIELTSNSSHHAVDLAVFTTWDADGNITSTEQLGERPKVVDEEADNKCRAKAIRVLILAVLLSVGYGRNELLDGKQIAVQTDEFWPAYNDSFKYGIFVSTDATVEVSEFELAEEVSDIAYAILNRINDWAHDERSESYRFDMELAENRIDRMNALMVQRVIAVYQNETKK